MLTFPHLGGFESTHIFGSGKDVLGTTRHIQLWQEDLMRLRKAGIKVLRYSAPWHRIEQDRGVFDWSWIDGPLRFMRDNAMQVILDPLHHTSFPEWLTGGFLHADFPRLYSEFLHQLSCRYPFVRSYTVFNEPLPTTLFCSYTGMWYPHLASDASFVSMALQVARAICIGCDVLRRNVSPRFVHVETAEHHRALDKRSEPWVEFANARRFLLTDLILGRMTDQHELYGYLRRHGASIADIRWFEDHPAVIDVLGLDYYIHSEMDWVWSGEKNRHDIADFVTDARGFASIAEDYIARYNLPIMLSETNLAGTVQERITWLRFMEQECEQLVASGVDFRGFCWYPSIDTTDWSNCCTRATGKVDPQGIWSLDAKTLNRVDTELSKIYSLLAQGRIASEEIPVYSFGPDLEKRLRGYKNLPVQWSAAKKVG